MPTVIYFPSFVRYHPFRVAYPSSLHRVHPITGWHLITMLPLPSVPRAGIFAPRVGHAVAEFPASNWRCGVAPRSCLLYAGWGKEAICTVG